MKKRILAILLVAVMAIGMFVGCGVNEEATSGSEMSAGVHANEITVGLANDLDSNLDPHKTTKAGTREVMFNVFDGLLKPTPNGDLAPALAEKYEVSENRLTYTFTLRDGVQYHNGDTVKASDVVWSFKRCIHPADPEIKPDDALENIADVIAVDDKTVAFTLFQPDVDFLSSMTLAVIPENYDRQNIAPVGTGPFKFVSRQAQDTVV
ncbi:dipeptide-binding protein, partial [gut metagenome]